MRTLILNCTAVVVLFALLSALAYDQRRQQCETKITTRIWPYQHLTCIQ